MKNNKIKDMYRFLMDIILINFLWLFVSALGFFITFGAATVALFSVSFKLLDTDNQVYIVKRYFNSFKENFIISTIVWFLIIIVAIPLFFIYNYALNVENTLLLISIYFTAFQLLLFAIYVFPIISIFKTKTLPQLIKNTMYMAYGHFPTTFKILGSLAFVILLIMKVHSFFILIAFGIYGILVSFHLHKIFSIYINRVEERLSE